MARKRLRSALRPMSEINMTPMSDLTFLLLITFIITFPMVENGIPVNLPKASTERVKPQGATRTVTIRDDGTIFLEDRAVTEEELRSRLAAFRQQDEDLSVMVRGDERIHYGQIVRVLKILHDLRIAKMALVTQADDRPAS